MPWPPPGPDQETATIATSGADDLLVGVDLPQAPHDLEDASVRLRDVHVEPEVVLPRDHLGRSTGALVETCGVESLHDCLGVERPRLLHGGGPQPEAAVHAGARAAGGELRASRVPTVVLREERRAERVVDLAVV